MAKDDPRADQSAAKPTPEGAPPASGTAQAQQGRYGSGGSYGVGGGFDDEEGRDSTPEEPDERAARAARSEAQQEGQQVGGFEREVDPDAAPHKHIETERSPEEEQLAAKNRRGSRI